MTHRVDQAIATLRWRAMTHFWTVRSRAVVRMNEINTNPDYFADRPTDRSESPLRRRSALNPMNVNSSIASDGTKTAKPHQYFPAGDSNTVPFSSHLPVSGNPYFQHQHSMGGGTYNPLYVQTRNGMFHPFSFAAFGTEPKVSTSSFQPINGAVNPNLAGMSYHSYQAPYGDESTHQRGNGGFDI